MDASFEITLLTASRTKLLKIMNELTEEQLFLIPAGFNNNVLWHIGHCVTSQQRLMYLHSNLPMRISAQYAANFKIGTSPLTWIVKPDPAEVEESLIGTLDQLKEDLNNQIFAEYKPLRSSMGFMINDHLEALSYTNFHEAEHTGNIQYMLKMIKGKV